MSFTGFTDKTLEYFLTMFLNNTKSNFEANRALYNDQVKVPLRTLHEVLVPAMLEIDPGLCVRPARCVSGAYNDARFARNEPIKTYMYLHFCAEGGHETDVPGFFMDASYNGYRYGLQIYRGTTQGMTRLRDAVLDNPAGFAAIAAEISKRGEFALEGDAFKRDHYPDAPPLLKDWLNRKRWWVGRDCQPDGAFFSEELSSRLADGFRALGALYHFIRRTNCGGKK